MFQLNSPTCLKGTEISGTDRFTWSQTQHSAETVIVYFDDTHAPYYFHI